MSRSFPLFAVVLLGCQAGPPPPAEEPAPKKAAPPAAEPVEQPARKETVARGLRVEGARVSDPRSGVSFIAPGRGELVPPGRVGGVRHDGGYRLRDVRFEVRLRLMHINRPGEAAKVARTLCAKLARSRVEKEVPVSLGTPRQCRSWRVQAAASAIYPFRHGRYYTHEETHVLVKGGRTLVVWKAFSSPGVTPALWSELNTSLNGSLAWGGKPRRLKRVRSFYVDRRARLRAKARQAARRLARRLAKAKVPVKDVTAAAVRVRAVAYGSDPPDAPLTDRALVLEAIAGALHAKVRAALKSEFEQRVVTYRDLRGLHQFFVVVAARFPK